MSMIDLLVATCLGAPPVVTPLHGWTVQGLESVGRLAVDAAGTTYVADPLRGVVVVRSEDGRVLRRGSGLGVVTGLALDTAGNVLVGDLRLGAVTAYRPDWTVAYVLGGGPAEFASPSDIDVDPATGRVYVADPVLGEVRWYAADGQLLGASDGSGADPDTALLYPTALAFDRATSRLYVVSQLTRKIVVFDADGSPVRAFGAHGERDGELYLPSGLAVDAASRLWVTDSRLARVTVFDDQGSLLGIVGAHGTRLSEFRQPDDVAFDTHGRAFVSDANNARVQVFGVDTFTDPERFVEATARFAPASLPRIEEPGSAGVLLAVAGFTGAEIVDVAAAGVPSSAMRAGDFDGDGAPDAYVRFDRAALLAALPADGLVRVAITGHVASGAEFATEADLDIVATAPLDTDVPVDTAPPETASSSSSATRPPDDPPPPSARNGLRCGCAGAPDALPFPLAPLLLLLLRRRS